MWCVTKYDRCKNNPDVPWDPICFNSFCNPLPILVIILTDHQDFHCKGDYIICTKTPSTWHFKSDALFLLKCMFESNCQLPSTLLQKSEPCLRDCLKFVLRHIILVNYNHSAMRPLQESNQQRAKMGAICILEGHIKQQCSLTRPHSPVIILCMSQTV